MSKLRSIAELRAFYGIFLPQSGIPDPFFDCVSRYLDCALLSDDADNRQRLVREEEKELEGVVEGVVVEGVEAVEGVEGRGRHLVLANDGGIIQVGQLGFLVRKKTENVVKGAVYQIRA